MSSEIKIKEPAREGLDTNQIDQYGYDDNEVSGGVDPLSEVGDSIRPPCKVTIQGI